VNKIVQPYFTKVENKKLVHVSLLYSVLQPPIAVILMSAATEES